MTRRMNTGFAGIESELSCDDKTSGLFAEVKDIRAGFPTETWSCE